MSSATNGYAPLFVIGMRYVLPCQGAPGSPVLSGLVECTGTDPLTFEVVALL